MKQKITFWKCAAVTVAAAGDGRNPRAPASAAIRVQPHSTPIPVSLTSTTSGPDDELLERVFTLPPTGVNFTAFLTT